MTRDTRRQQRGERKIAYANYKLGIILWLQIDLAGEFMTLFIRNFVTSDSSKATWWKLWSTGNWQEIHSRGCGGRPYEVARAFFTPHATTFRAKPLVSLNLASSGVINWPPSQSLSLTGFRETKRVLFDFRFASSHLVEAASNTKRCRASLELSAECEANLDDVLSPLKLLERKNFSIQKAARSSDCSSDCLVLMTSLVDCRSRLRSLFWCRKLLNLKVLAMTRKHNGVGSRHRKRTNVQ